MTLRERLEAAWQKSSSLLCVGLDPDPAKIPSFLRDHETPIFEFNRRIIEATADCVCCYKPQIAFYAAARAEDELEMTIELLRRKYPDVFIILDAKRSDIGNTAEMYAKEAFVRYQADAVTVNPYLGGDSLEPFLKDPKHGAVILCRTSNAGAGDLQDLKIDGRPLYRVVAEKAKGSWNKQHNVLLVVGATYPEEMREIRAAAGDIPFLVPGIGAQGGDIKAVLENGMRPDRSGLIISASRSVLYASSGEDFADAARTEAVKLKEEINRHRGM